MICLSQTGDDDDAIKRALHSTLTYLENCKGNYMHLLSITGNYSCSQCSGVWGRTPHPAPTSRTF